jgi:predicted dehydrogenase
VGEVCHFIDLMHFLTGSRVIRVFAEKVGRPSGEAIDEDSVFITLAFADGSNGAIAYLAEGDKKLSKERVEIYGGGQTFVIDDFHETSAFAGGKEVRNRTKSQDKGQAEQARVVCGVVRNGLDAPITLESLATTTRATFRIHESLRTGNSAAV